MFILAIETTGKHASVALIDEQGRIHEVDSDATFNHLRSLIPMTDRLLADGGIAPGDLACVAVSIGPGSFTGIRIGVSTARALSQALDIPVTGVSSLRAFAYNAPDYDGLICPVFDARRGQVYGGAFRWRRGAIEEAVTPAAIEDVVAPGAYELEAFLALVASAAANGKPQGVMFFGDGTETYRQEIESRFARDEASETGQSPISDIRFEFAPEEIRFQRASSVARLAQEQFNRGETYRFEELMPDYMRKAEAERRLPQIREAEAADIEAILDVEGRCFVDPWSELTFQEEIAKNQMAVYFVAAVDERVVGYAGFWAVAGEGHITNVAVLPEYRRKGIAAMLVQAMLDAAGRESVTDYTLEVRASNEAALALYRKFGFEMSGVRKKYYQNDDEDAIIMWRSNQ